MVPLKGYKLYTVNDVAARGSTKKSTAETHGNLKRQQDQPWDLRQTWPSWTKNTKITTELGLTKKIYMMSTHSWFCDVSEN